MPSPVAFTPSNPSVVKERPAGHMFFGEAMAAVLSGKRVTRVEWNDLTVYLFLLNGILSIHKADGQVSNLLVSDGDLSGSDWTVVN